MVFNAWFPTLIHTNFHAQDGATALMKAAGSNSTTAVDVVTALITAIASVDLKDLVGDGRA